MWQWLPFPFIWSTRYCFSWLKFIKRKLIIKFCVWDNLGSTWLVLNLFIYLLSIHLSIIYLSTYYLFLRQGLTTQTRLAWIFNYLGCPHIHRSLSAFSSSVLSLKSCDMIQSWLYLSILLWPPQCWHYRHLPLCQCLS